MLTPFQFVERWQAEVVPKSACADEPLARLPCRGMARFPLLPGTARQFLSEAGLPKSCAPCLTFDDLTDGLRHLWEVFSPSQWRQEEKRRLEHYGLIGSDGAGDPICIDERDGRVIILNHELLFDPSSEETRVR